MTNLTRLDPFAELARFDPMWDVDDVISRFMLRPFLRSGLEMEPQIRMDVKCSSWFASIRFGELMRVSLRYASSIAVSGTPGFRR